MIERAVTTGVPFAWVAGDEVYGGNPALRVWLEEEIPYVLAVACSEMVDVAAGPRRADELAALVPAAGWQRLSCADGSKGPRLYDWALIETASPGHWLLACRSLYLGEKGVLELAFFRCWSPWPVTLPELVAMAGARWGIEDCFGEAKNETGLDHYQVRKYRAWYGHVTLSMLAHAFLAVTARATRSPGTTPEPLRGTLSVRIRVACLASREEGESLTAPLRAIGTPWLARLPKCPTRASAQCSPSTASSRHAPPTTTAPSCSATCPTRQRASCWSRQAPARTAPC